ncbi:MAG: DUF2029 domain-containing protein [Verrucomicrobiota bacterium]|nr:DUF2029 domain-containing protein [Verrucomicrobiota bacterium]
MALVLVIAFGALVERRTALRRQPGYTDLTVFARAAWAVRHGDSPYNVSDANGWHYQYPPTFAILFVPLADAPLVSLPALPAGEKRIAANTPWGYDIASHEQFYGLHRDNFRFFCIVGIWYCISVALTFLSVHLLACALEKKSFAQSPPRIPGARGRWWSLRGLSFLTCAISLGTDWSRGQTDVLMLAAISLAFYLAGRSRDWVAGIFLALPAAIKIFPLVLLLYPLWRRRWRMVAGMLAGFFIFLIALPVITFGPRKTIASYQTLARVLIEPALGGGLDTTRARELTNITTVDNQSLLACVHRWHYRNVPITHRPPQAPAMWRAPVCILAAIALAGILALSRLRRHDSPQEMLILGGLLLCVPLIANPIVHNFYYLLLLPLLSALIDRALPARIEKFSDLRMPWPVIFFMLTDMLVRLPRIGEMLRDFCLPLLSVLVVMTAGGIALWKRTEAKPSSLYGERSLADRVA